MPEENTEIIINHSKKTVLKELRSQLYECSKLQEGIGDMSEDDIVSIYSDYIDD
jgi:hypothetical protein